MNAQEKKIIKEVKKIIDAEIKLIEKDRLHKNVTEVWSVLETHSTAINKILQSQKTILENQNFMLKEIKQIKKELTCVEKKY